MPNIFDGLDLWVVAYAAGMALLASLVTTARARQAQRLSGLPLSGWWTTLPDTAAGCVVGTFAALGGPHFLAALNNFTGITFLAAFGGISGPRVWDWLSSEAGVRKVTGLLLQAASGSLAKLAAAQAAPKERDNNGSNQNPPSP